MSIFSKLNQIKDLRSQAKTIQNALAQEKVTVEKSGLSLTMDGNQKIINLNIPTELLTPENKSSLESLFISVHADVISKIQRLMAEKMKSMGNLNIPGLS